MIEGVKVIPLVKHVDERGFLMEILRSDQEHFLGFGQVYITTCDPQPGKSVVKAWHRHQKQHDHFCCLQGKVKVGLYDARKGSPTEGKTQAVILGGGHDCLLQIPPGVWHGFMPLGLETACVLNIPTETYNYAAPDEERAAWDAFPFEWEVESR
ncbi:MAG: dTDP-4-dehydrorhamnose 3,5-epimerase family protein [Candidatus Zipacnadales bacterium]